MATIVLLVVIGVIALWVISAYNGLISLKNQVVNGWKQIDVQLKRRHDLIPNLVNTVKGAMEFERSTLDAVISARNRAVGATGVQQTARAEGELTQALGRLFALTEAYPDLKATGNVAQLQEELTSTENKIGFARQLYNDVATQYNTRQMQFPTNLVAGLAQASPAELWEIEDAGRAGRPGRGSVGDQTRRVSDDANLFAQQQSNRRRSTLLTIGFILFFAWVGFGGDLALYLITADAPPDTYRHVFPFIGVLSVLSAALLCWYSWRFGDRRVLMGGRSLGADRARHPGAEEAGECGGGDGDRRRAAAPESVGDPRRRSQRLRDRP